MKWKLVACLLEESQRNNREGDWEGQRERKRHRCQPLGFHRLSWSPLLSPSICPLALFHPLSPSERLKSSSVGEQEFRRNPKLLSHTQRERWHHRKALDWMSTESHGKESHWSRDWEHVLCMCVLRYKGWIRVWLELQCTIALSLAWFIHIHTTPPQCVSWKGKHRLYLYRMSFVMVCVSEQFNVEFPHVINK